MLFAGVVERRDVARRESAEGNLQDRRRHVCGGTGRAIAIGTRPEDVPRIGFPPRDPFFPVTTYVYVDVDRSGNFEASNDLFIQLTSVPEVSLQNFVF